MYVKAVAQIPPVFRSGMQSSPYFHVPINCFGLVAITPLCEITSTHIIIISSPFGKGCTVPLINSILMYSGLQMDLTTNAMPIQSNISQCMLSCTLDIIM